MYHSKHKQEGVYRLTYVPELILLFSWETVLL
jgi:hypothetical protein